VRLDVRRKESLRDNSGITVRVKVAKNKIAPPFRTVELDILFGTGIDTVACLLDAAETAELIVRKGSWYSYAGKNVGQGRLNTVEYLKQNPDVSLSCKPCMMCFHLY
jgi:recombination protein RecA